MSVTSEIRQMRGLAATLAVHWWWAGGCQCLLTMSRACYRANLRCVRGACSAFRLCAVVVWCTLCVGQGGRARLFLFFITSSTKKPTPRALTARRGGGRRGQLGGRLEILCASADSGHDYTRLRGVSVDLCLSEIRGLGDSLTLEMQDMIWLTVVAVALRSTLGTLVRQVGAVLQVILAWTTALSPAGSPEALHKAVCSLSRLARARRVLQIPASFRDFHGANRNIEVHEDSYAPWACCSCRFEHPSPYVCTVYHCKCCH